MAVRVHYVRRAGGLLVARLTDGTETTLVGSAGGNMWFGPGKDVPPPPPPEPEPEPDPTPPPSTDPVTGTSKWVHFLPRGRLTSGYGQRSFDYHVGVDVSTPKADLYGPGGNVLAVCDMKIVIAKEYRTGGLDAAGTYVKGHTIAGTPYSFSYFHMHPGTMRVRVGQIVKAGTILGIEGNSGNSFGSHVHFEIWRGHMQGDFFYWGHGTPPNPVPILNANGVYL